MTFKVPLALAIATVVFCCFPLRQSSAIRTSQQPAPVASPKPTPVDPLAVELSVWQAIKDSQNIEDFKAYLNKYPQGEFAALAKNKINSLANSAVSSSFDQLFDRHIRALGDKAAIESMATLVLKGTVELTTNGQKVSGTTERYFKFPDKSYVLINTPIGNLTQGYDGTVGWKNLGLGPVTMNAGETAFQNRSNFVFTRITHVDQFKSSYQSFFMRGKMNLDGREVQVVDAEPLIGDRETIYFDAATGLIYRWDIINESDGAGRQRIELYADEYTVVDGVKILKAIKVVTPTATIASRFTEIKMNIPVDELIFRKR